jgi:hypothetical protein
MGTRAATSQRMRKMVKAGIINNWKMGREQSRPFS